MALSAAIEPGTSAMELAADIKTYLNEPDKMFRRFRYKDEEGNWRRKWKQKVLDGDGKVHFVDADPKAYHPGRGVYRSSARNAQRLARTEINMAYRAAEQERWKSFDFVVGYEVKITQNGKHVEDICDCLKGKYRKDFKFMGWHPQCYKDDMDVLTKVGWKRFKDVSDDDLIMSLNPDTRDTEWTSVVDRQCYDFYGVMMRFYNDNLDCVVTPDHRMPYESTETGQILYCTAERYNYTLGGFINGEKVFFKEYYPYSGKVYDLTLDRNHIMYVRRNGKCFWGSNCMCYTIPILKTEDEFFDDDDDAKSVNEVEDVPQGFVDWIKDNKERIDKAEKRGTVPYFIADNRDTVKRILEGGGGNDKTQASNDKTETKDRANHEVPPHVEEYKSYSDGKIMVSPLHGKDELDQNLKLAETLYEAMGETVYLLPNINPNGGDAHLRTHYIPAGVKDGKNADFMCANRIWDGKEASFEKSDRSRKSIKSIIENHIKKAKQQADNMIIEIPDWVKEEWVEQVVTNHLRLTSANRWIIIKRENGEWRLYKK